MGIQYDILASTLRILRDREVDNTFRTIPLLEAVQRAGNVEMVNGGQKVDHPVILAEHSNITQLSTGYESVNLAVKDALRTASFDWCDFVAPVVITEKEQLSNKGERAIIRIAEARLKSVMGMLKREWCKQTVTGNSTLLGELNTLNGEGVVAAGAWGAAAAANTNGFFNREAFGSQLTNSVGGIAKSAFTSSWQNQVADAGGNFGTAGAGLKAMSNLMINTQLYAPEGEVDIILASPTSYELYRNELTDQERYTSADQTRDIVGKLILMYNGASMYIDKGLGFTTAAGAKPVSMYFLNSKLFSVYFDKDAHFEMGEMERISGYAAASSNIMVRTQLAASHLAGQGVLLNGEA
ncbi:MAG: phage major capsid protein [Gammaproteobacteria bacterium]|nr:phage major capsid protein [Gammaproteobacteria bacterium]